MSNVPPPSTPDEPFNTQDMQRLWNDDLTKAPSHAGQPQDSAFAGRAMLHPGARPLPDYELVRKLGEGGVGEVWQARGPGGVDVALKFIRLGNRGGALETRSLEVMKNIRHPNLVSLLGIWRTDNLLILAMELCDRSLEERLREAMDQQQPGIPPQELLKYMAAAAEGLDELNQRNVQHRDGKPANLLLVGAGIKVADFGLAKALEQSMANNSTGVMTPYYTTPESFRGKVARQSDQYSLAMTYYHLRTGRVLFGGGLEQVMCSHLMDEPNLAALLPAEGAVVARALSKEPEKRWPNSVTFVTELQKAHALQDILSGKTLTLPAVPEPIRGGKTILAPRKNAPGAHDQAAPNRGIGWPTRAVAVLCTLVLMACVIGIGIFVLLPRLSMQSTNSVAKASEPIPPQSQSTPPKVEPDKPNPPEIRGRPLGMKFGW